MTKEELIKTVKKLEDTVSKLNEKVRELEFRLDQMDEYDMEQIEREG